INVSKDSAKMRFCRSLQSLTFANDHSSIACLSFRNIPDPEHGASTTSRSKYPGSLLKDDGSLLVTTTLADPQRPKLSRSILALDSITSFDTSRLPAPG